MKALSKFTSYVTLIVLGLSVGVVASCKKKAGTEPAATTAAAAQLPGASEVLASLEKKEYAEAVAALMKLNETVTTEEQKVQYMVLTRQVKDKLIEAAPTDPKAAEALSTLRVATMGR